MRSVFLLLIFVLGGCATTFQTNSYDHEIILSKIGKIWIYAIPTRVKMDSSSYKSGEPYTIHFNYFTKDEAGIKTSITILGVSVASSERHGVLVNTPQITKSLPDNSDGNSAKYSASLSGIYSGASPITLSFQLDYGSDTELFKVALKPIYRESSENLFINTIKREF
ncbi:MAG: hypothetical protein KUG82_14115 [Pseudomonadales bacterium]|nr:hypothetical protein [Pseudomonadales bacterium]